MVPRRKDAVAFFGDQEGIYSGRREMKQPKRNIKRAERIAAAIKGYAEARDDDYGAEPFEEHVSDLLTDLMHYSDMHGVNFPARLRFAQDSYFHETKKGE